MRHRFRLLTLIALGLGAAAGPVSACAPDAVEVGRLCVDRYEASVWKIVPGNTALIAAVRAGTVADAAQLTANGALRRGENGDDYGAACADDAAHCVKLYAVSIPGVRPSAHLTWFQALAACRNSGNDC